MRGELIKARRPRRQHRRQHRRRDRGPARVARRVERCRSTADPAERRHPRRRGRRAHTKTPTGGEPARRAARRSRRQGGAHRRRRHAAPFKRDPISELIQLEDPRKREAIVAGSSAPRRRHRRSTDAAAERRASDHTPLPPPRRGEDSGSTLPRGAREQAKPRPASRSHEPARDRGRAGSRADGVRANDELAALAAIAELDERAASSRRGERSRRRASTRGEDVAPPPRRPKPKPASRRAPRPVSAIEPDRSRRAGAAAQEPRSGRSSWALLRARRVGVGVYVISIRRSRTRASAAEEKDKAAAQGASRAARSTRTKLADAGNDRRSTRRRRRAACGCSSGARRSTTTVDRVGVARLPTCSSRSALELDGYKPIDTQVAGSVEPGSGRGQAARRAKIDGAAQASPRIDSKGRPRSCCRASADRPPPAVEAGPFPTGRGVDPRSRRTPAGAEVWLFIGIDQQRAVRQPDRGPRLRVPRAQGRLPAGVHHDQREEWRDAGDDPKMPLDGAKKETLIAKSVDARCRIPKAPKPK